MVEKIGYSDFLIDNKYQVVQEIGSGGTSVVYLAYHTTLQKYVVLKKIKQNTMGASMMKREADLLKNLHHTYLPTVYDYISFNGDVYTVIDYISGNSLEDYIMARTPVDIRTAQRWLTQLCEVLDYLHKQQPRIIHSDIKPGNIIITPENNVCLIDFNISLDGSADVSGYSRFYASPEQIVSAIAEMSGQHSAIAVDERTDIYSLGATFYNLISGIVPRDDAPNAPLRSIMQDDNVLYGIIDKAMAIDREKRYRSAAQMLRQLTNIYKYTRSYKLLNLLRWVSVTAGAALIVGGAVMCVYGSQLKKDEQFVKDYDSVIKAYNNEEYDEAIDSGTELINQASAKPYFKNDPEKKADVLGAVASSYYAKGDYGNAAYFYELACDVDGEDEGEYYYNYICSLINNGDDKEAQKAFKKIGSHDVDSTQTSIIQMEFMSRSKQYAELTAYYSEHAAADKLDRSARALALCGEGYTGLGLYTQALSFYEAAYKLDSGSDQLRRLGEGYFDVCNMYIRADNESRKNEHDSEITENRRKAAACFEKLTALDYPRSSDYINLLQCYKLAGQHTEAEQLIREMTKDLSKDYRVFAEAARYYRDVSQSAVAAEYAAKAKELAPKNGLTEDDKRTISEMDAILNGR